MQTARGVVSDFIYYLSSPLSMKAVIFSCFVSCRIASSWVSAWHMVGIGKHVLSEGRVSTAADAGVERVGGEQGQTQGKSSTTREAEKVLAAKGAKPEAPPEQQCPGCCWTWHLS